MSGRNRTNAQVVVFFGVVIVILFAIVGVIADRGVGRYVECSEAGGQIVQGTCISRDVIIDLGSK